MTVGRRFLGRLLGCAAALWIWTCDDPAPAGRAAAPGAEPSTQRPGAVNPGRASTNVPHRPATLYRDAYERARGEITQDNATEVLEAISAEIEREKE